MADASIETGGPTASRAVDLERMIAIDRAHSGTARRRFYEKRFRAAELHPQDYIHVEVRCDGELTGFALARLLQGEFGRDDAVAILDVIGVEPGSQEHGYGHELMARLVAALRQQGVRLVQSQAHWTAFDLLKFFASTGFELAPRLVLERFVSRPLEEPNEDE
jgi:N-acetylglutamate synthase-like GNAT family acetyltransferase